MLHPVFWKRAASAALLAACASLVWAQQGSEGTVTITVTDPSGSVVPGAKVQLRDPATNSVRSGATQDSGAYSFVNLPIGHYTLTVSKPGFSTQSLPSVVVQAARVTDVPVKLQVGATTVTVEVKGGAAPVLETTSNSIGTTIDIKQIEDLPIQGRDLTSLANLTPGYNGTWDGLPSNAQGNNVDGVIGSPTRMKFGGNAHPSVTPRLEDIAQMTVQTSQLNLNQGFGQATMQINFVTRRGTNQFHGRVFEDFQNSVLNANSWYNDAAGLPKSHLELNNFGGSVGGPILKNKLFFFGSFSMSKQPGSFVANNDVLTSAAQAGNFTYTGSDGAVHTVNVLDTARNYDSTINPTIASELQSINKSLSAGAVTPTSDPNMNTLSWLQPSPTTYYYPTFRIDYNMSDALHFDFAYNETKEVQPSVSQSFFPGPDYADQIAGNKADNKTLALGIEWTISPTLVNEFRGGFNYNATWYAYNSAPLYDTLPQISWDFPNGTGNMSGQNFNLPITTYYPVFNASDTMTWQHNKHTFMYGFSWYREQDHYWNNPEGYPNIRLGLSTGDPALSAFSNTGANATLPAATSAQLGEAEQLYAILTGRIGNASGASSVIGQFAKEQNGDQYRKGIGAFNLDELQSAWGLFFQDSWHVTPTLTLNYGLRWDFTGDDHDLTGSYHGATLDSIYGPSGVGNLFRPGYLPGDMNPTLTAREHQYNGWDVTPQPAFGFAWNPKFASGFLGKLTGNGKTVIRGGYSLRRFTEPHQYFWNNASDYGSFFYQNFFLNANTSGTPGSFAPGSLTLGNPFPPYGLAPATYLASAPLADYTFTGTIGANGFNQNIDQPYTESWNFGIQREIGNDSVLEIRYNGNRTIHQWLQLDTNEVNIFENGFLKQFQTAQQNFKINQQHGISSFANNGYAGQQATPIFNAAFAGEKSGGAGVPLSDYGNTTFINELNTGQAGAMAGTLSSINGTAPYFCNLVGSSFTPCVTNAGYTGPGAGYPINFFQANPFSPGTSLGYQGTPASLMDSPGYSNYNALQVDFRQRPWHGIEFDANYTWSHTLGIETPNSWTASFPNYTLRNLHLAYGPALFDHRHVVHVNATVDLPFGKGREWMNRGGILNAVLGGWTVGDIFTFETGAPFVLDGGNDTFNDYGDGGIDLNGITASTLQSAVGVYRVPSATHVNLINPKYLVSATGGGANPAYITPNTTPGTFGSIVYLHAPHETFNDMALSKQFPITERVRFTLQGEFLNIFNHPNFYNNQTQNIQNFNFGNGVIDTAGRLVGSRVIELRANIEF